MQVLEHKRVLEAKISASELRGGIGDRAESGMEPGGRNVGIVGGNPGIDVDMISSPLKRHLKGTI